MTSPAEPVVQLGHGSGGRLTAEIINDLFRPAFGTLGELDDSAVLNHDGGQLLFTTDSFVVNPLFFPGGDIGRLAVCGTVNDIASQGGRPLWLSFSVVAAEGLAMSVLKKVVDSVARAARRVGVKVVTGDTKVVERGAIDGLILNTAGIGRVLPKARISTRRVAPNDVVIVTGEIGAHEAAVLCRRNDLGFSDVLSDCAPVDRPAALLVAECGPRLKWMRDPTRGGLATVLNELALAANLTIEIDEAAVPIGPPVRNVSEILGLDPLYLACEGRLVALVDGDHAKAALGVLAGLPESAGSRIIGRVTGAGRPQVVLNTVYGGARILRYLAADQQPRIC